MACYSLYMNTLLKVIAVSLLAEEWREHPQYPGRYYVSSLGRVYGLGGKYGSARILRPQSVSRNGRTYLKLCLWANDKRSKFGVHQLVAECFIGSRPDGCTQTRHLDGNQFNNAYWNLAWGTALDNAADRKRHGRY